MNGWFASTSLGVETGSTKKVVAHRIGYIISTRKQATVLKRLEMLGILRLETTALTTEIVNRGKPGVRQAMVPQQQLFLCKGEILVLRVQNIGGPKLPLVAGKVEA